MQKTCIALLIWCTVGAPLHAQEIHAPKYCLYGCPSGVPDTNDLIIRDIYILSSNDLTKFADWVAYKVTKETVGSEDNRNYKSDPLLEEDETLEEDDYNNAAEYFDHGHQAPLASFARTAHWKETNYLSNITPQVPNLNRGRWSKLEEKVRELAKLDGITGVYVMTGPLYEKSMPPLPKADEAHVVPSGYWKIISVEVGNMIKTIAFIFDQKTYPVVNYCHFTVTVHEVEIRSGLKFFHGRKSRKLVKLDHGLMCQISEQ